LGALPGLFHNLSGVVFRPIIDNDHLIFIRGDILIDQML
jgi:hypothetical protein